MANETQGQGPGDAAQGGGPRRRHSVRWRHTLYARASLFVLLGGGALVGALSAMSSRLVDASVDRLLDERLDLARTVGGLVERRIVGELTHMTRHAARRFDDPVAVRESLALDYPTTVFREGAFALDVQGEPIVALPSGTGQLDQVLDLRELAARSAAADGAVISPLLRLPVGHRPVLVVLGPVRGRDGAIRGYVGGVIHPTASDLLRDVTEIRGAATTELELIDAEGTVVASTTTRGLFQSGDHESALEEALAERRPFKGRCHSCHTQDDEEPAGTDVMSFSPLPRLALGLAVYQPEDAALAPAFDLRRQLLMAIAVVALFMIFLGFAVNSVVRPVVRLTRAVDALEAGGGGALPVFGRDEVGVLARSFDTWRGRMTQAMVALDESRQRARDEAEATRAHLEALEQIVAQSAVGADVEAVLSCGLRHLMAIMGLEAGVLRLTWGEDVHLANVGVEPALVEARLARAGRVSLDDALMRWSTVGQGRCALETRVDADAGGDSWVFTHQLAPHGVRMVAAMRSSTPPGGVPQERVHSLLFHLCMTATGRILRDREQARQQQQERYLRGVLDAQEKERARIARDLHDTIAQDLAALRLDLERLTARLPDDASRARVQELEAHAAEILRTTRAILLDLRLTVLDSMGFVATLQWHLERLGREHGVRGTLSIDGDERRLGYYLEVALLRVFQECLNNVVQHAEAEQVFVTLAFEDGGVTLTVEDDGRGFDPSVAAAPDERGGLGLLGMYERTRLLGGVLVITAAPGEGTTVAVTVPSDALGALDPPTQPETIREEAS